MNGTGGITPERPAIVPLGDSALLVRFATSLDDSANQWALALARALADDPVAGVVEVVPSLVSVLLRYDPIKTEPVRLAGEIGLRLRPPDDDIVGEEHVIAMRFGGEAGPDLGEVAGLLGLNAGEFVRRHNETPLRVLTTGFAPGFVYCGFHPEALVLPRRTSVRPMVPAGSVLFAAGQTAIAATDIPTGWHVIGQTRFNNFDAARMPPTTLRAGDIVRFEAET